MRGEITAAQHARLQAREQRQMPERAEKGGIKKDRMLDYARCQSNGDKRRETSDPPPPSGIR